MRWFVLAFGLVGALGCSNEKQVLAGCETSAECRGGEICRSGECRQACSADDPCSSGGVCDMALGYCLDPECADDVDCRGGEECRDSLCVPIDVPLSDGGTSEPSRRDGGASPTTPPSRRDAGSTPTDPPGGEDASIDPPIPVTDDPLCNDTCQYANDGECDDGGPMCQYSVCDYGSDCSDCGRRRESDRPAPGSMCEPENTPDAGNPADAGSPPSDAGGLGCRSQSDCGAGLDCCMVPLYGSLCLEPTHALYTFCSLL